MKAIILGGGFGTRLKPLTDNCAKPLIHVADVPIIEYSVQKVNTLSSLEEIVVVSNDRFFEDYEAWAEDVDSNVPIRILNDGSTCADNRLGAIGDCLFAMEEMGQDEDVLVIGGDNIYTFDLQPMLDLFHQDSKRHVIALYDVGSLALAKKYGVVEVANDGEVSSMTEKPDDPKSTLVSVCIYMFRKGIHGLLKQYRRQSKSMDRIGDFVGWLVANEPVYGKSLDGTWFDIGDFDSLEKANEFFGKQ